MLTGGFWSSGGDLGGIIPNDGVEEDTEGVRVMSNPFRHETEIRLSLAGPMAVRAEVFDYAGRLV